MHTRFARPLALRALLSLLTAAAALTPIEAWSAGPKISGSPPTTIRVKTYYTFSPKASDPDTPRSKLRFSIVNKPGWAKFSVYSGKLTGVPSTVAAWSNIRISVTDGKTKATLPAFKITAVKGSSGSGNGAPRISGSPPRSVTPGTAYAFTPTASDPNGDKLTFSIANRPAWAAFNSSTGRLSGTPTSAQVGAYSNIRITVSDGRASASLAAFSVTVSDIASGSATVSWTPPTRNTDGSRLSNLAGYRIYYGTSAGALNRTVQVPNASVATYVIENLSPATWYFAVRAYNSAGVESALSKTASKTVR